MKDYNKEYLKDLFEFHRQQSVKLFHSGENEEARKLQEMMMLDVQNMTKNLDGEKHKVEFHVKNYLDLNQSLIKFLTKKKKNKAVDHSKLGSYGKYFTRGTQRFFFRYVRDKYDGDECCVFFVKNNLQDAPKNTYCSEIYLVLEYIYSMRKTFDSIGYKTIREKAFKWSSRSR